MFVPRRRPSVVLAVVAALTLLVAACGGDDGDDESGTGPADIAAQVASYELVAGKPQRFLVGLAESGTGNLVSFGEVALQFEFLGEGTDATPVPGPTTTASFTPVAGQDVDLRRPGPRVAPPSEGIGVYRAADVVFDRPGFWRVVVETELDERAVRASAAFEVVETPSVPFPGTPAPRTANPVAGSAGVDPVALDSRAEGGEPIPDLALHSTSVAAALDAGRPVVVVVSTPVYCVSRFCGPITDSAEQLAETYGDRVAFVHLEVWQNFSAKQVNPFALEWLGAGSSSRGLTEPWVFLVGRDGMIRQRFDNVVGDEELRSAVEALAAS